MTFFENLASIEQFTRNLTFTRIDMSCPSCEKNNTFVSHGYLYKGKGDKLRVTGKRILCSTKRGLKGCGKTKALYLNNEIPKLHFDSQQVSEFFRLIYLGFFCYLAYLNVTNTQEPTNAYRWVKRFKMNTGKFRTLLYPYFNQPIKGHSTFKETLSLFFNPSTILKADPIAAFQQKFQVSFFKI